MKVFPWLLCGAAFLALGYWAGSSRDEPEETRSYRSLDECLGDASSMGDRQLCRNTYDAVMSDTTAVPTFQNQSACEGEFSAGGCRQVSNSSLWAPLLTGFMISRAMDHRRPVYSAMPLYKQWQEPPRKGSGTSWWPSSYSSVPYTSSSSSSSRPSSSSYSPSSSGSSSSSWFGSRSSRSTGAAPPTTSGKDGSTSTSSPRSSTSAWGISSTPKASNDNSSDASSSRKSSPVGIASPSVSRGGFGSSASSSASRGG
ncbi:DUF1190 domain-containing protein [Insolitispirillum peregrinum]|uniref:DUF1190 domain-containing protein n=1 Tax=Insolitispirillum peregrinum TaxID=80876 RepID=A0A1N7MUE6_9PROT|nr:DUF1190 domain-containing protein [Insolitispirillum peregrinum]SIS89726.1 Protein of unknown function [Insolitispirillum peregrinum]